MQYMCPCAKRRREVLQSSAPEQGKEKKTIQSDADFHTQKQATQHQQQIHEKVDLNSDIRRCIWENRSGPIDAYIQV